MRSAMKRTTLFTTLFTLLAFATPAFAEKPQDALTLDIEGKRGGKLVLALSGNPATFNPRLLDGIPTFKTVVGYIYLSLTRYDYETGETKPELAKSWEVSKDNLTYTFHLRKGLKWSDGHPFTADDVVYSFKATFDPNVNSPEKAGFLQSDGTFPEVTKIDDHTVQFKLKEIKAIFLTDVGGVYLAPYHKIKGSIEAGKFSEQLKINTPVDQVVGLGPYKIKKYTPDQVVILERNPHYWKYDKNGVQLPYLDKVYRLIVPDQNAKAIKLENGELDMMEVRSTDFDQAKRAESKAGYTVYDLGPSHNVSYYNFNLNPRKNKDGKPYVDPKKLKYISNKKFRQALSHATNRQSLADVVFLGRATPVFSLTSPGKKYWHNPNGKKFDYDVAKAKALLDEIGLKDLNGDGYRDLPSGDAFSFEMATNVDNEVRVKAINLLKDDFAKVGIKMKIKPIPFKTLIDKITKNYEYESIFLSWGAGVPPDPITSSTVIPSSAAFHVWNPNQETPHTEWEAQMDKLFSEMQQITDRSERRKVWHKILDIWHEQLPQTMVITTNKYVAIKNNFGNTKPSVMRPYFDWNIYEIFDKNAK